MQLSLLHYDSSRRGLSHITHARRYARARTLHSTSHLSLLHYDSCRQSALPSPLRQLSTVTLSLHTHTHTHTHSTRESCARHARTHTLDSCRQLPLPSPCIGTQLSTVSSRTHTHARQHERQLHSPFSMTTTVDS